MTDKSAAAVRAFVEKWAPEAFLPEGEVLAGDFAPGTIGFKELLVGWLKEEGGIVYCDNDNDFLNSVTHYIPIHDIDIYINRLP